MKRKNILLLVFTLMLAVCMTGCSFIDDLIEPYTHTTLPTEDDPLELVIILGSHQNAWLSLDDLAGNGEEATEFAKLIKRTIEYSQEDNLYVAKANVKVVVCDGSPREATLNNIKGEPLELTVSAASPAYISRVHEEMAADIAEALGRDNLIANDEQVDLVAALIEASYLFESGDEREKMIYIMDTGVCTSGPLNMMNFDINVSTADEIMLGLNSGDFADLEGIQVKFRNFGDICGDQPIIRDTGFWNTMTTLWKAYLTKCNAAGIDVRHNGNEYDPTVDQYDGSKYQKVSVVPFTVDEDGIFVRPAKEEFDPDKDANLILNDETVGGFDGTGDGGTGLKPKDEEKARAIAKEQKEFIDKVIEIYPDCKFFVVGSCSYPNDNQPHDTHPGALGRAETIAQYLIEAGVPAERIIVVDAGTNRLEWRKGDELTEKEQNRLVAIIPSYRYKIVEHLNDILGDARVPLNVE